MRTFLMMGKVTLDDHVNVLKGDISCTSHLQNLITFSRCIGRNSFYTVVRNDDRCEVIM